MEPEEFHFSLIVYKKKKKHLCDSNSYAQKWAFTGICQSIN